MFSQCPETKSLIVQICCMIGLWLPVVTSVSSDKSTASYLIYVLVRLNWPTTFF